MNKRRAGKSDSSWGRRPRRPVFSAAPVRRFLPRMDGDLPPNRSREKSDMRGTEVTEEQLQHARDFLVAVGEEITEGLNAMRAVRLIDLIRLLAWYAGLIR